jgi:hypothetical protein
MKMYKALALLTLISITVATNAGFYAEQLTQEKHPSSFVLSSNSDVFINAIYSTSFKEADKFIMALKSDQKLWNLLQNWDKLSLQEQIPLLKKVFNHEVKSLGIAAPKLIIDLNYKRAAFFEFADNLTGTGTVYLNPSLVYSENKYSSLSLLIHETRHSAQLQMTKANHGMSHLGYFFRESFMTQKKIGHQLGFCDFLTLNNEYEAFLFGNYVIHKITAGTIDIKGMGTFASQFNKDGSIKIDLKKLHNDPHNNVLNKFNQLEEMQAQRLGIQ